MFLGSLPDPAKIDPAAVIGQLNHNLIILVLDWQPNLALRRLAKRGSFLGTFNAVVNRVPDQLCKDFLYNPSRAVIHNNIVDSFHHKTNFLIQRDLGFIANTRQSFYKNILLLILVLAWRFPETFYFGNRFLQLIHFLHGIAELQNEREEVIKGHYFLVFFLQCFYRTFKFMQPFAKIFQIQNKSVGFYRMNRLVHFYQHFLRYLLLVS